MSPAHRRPAQKPIAWLAALLLLLPAAYSQTARPSPSPSPSPSPTPEPAPSSTASASAATANTTTTGTFPAGTQTFRVPLRNLIGMEGSIMLRNDRAIYTLFMPIPARYKVLRCRLVLDYTNSVSLLVHRSSLSVALNDRILRQMRLDPNFPSNVVTVDFPVSLLKPNFNQVQFIVAQRSTERCQDPNAAELYTQINPDTSYFEAEMIPQPVPLRLSAIRDIVDEKLWLPYSFHLVFPGGTSQDETMLSWGSIVTQGVALALGAQPFRVSHSEGIREGRDNIVIAPRNALSAFLTAPEISMITGSFIGVKTLKDDPSNYLIVISGNTPDEVGQAALAFSLINFPLPDSQFALVDRLAIPEKPVYIRNSPLSLAGSYSLRRLGYRTRTIRGFNTGAFEVPIYLPGDLSQNDMSNVEMRLNFVYGSAFRNDSVLNVFINDTFHQSFRINNLNGAYHAQQKIFLPTRGFLPGRNVIRIAPLMVPLETDECQLDQVENLLFTLYDDSLLVMPDLQKGAILPSLGLLSQTGFPYTASPDGTETSVYITSREPDSINAAWTFLGKTAQISGTLLHRAEITYRMTRSRRNLLVVGPASALPDEVTNGAPISLADLGRYRYKVSANPEPGSALPSGLDEVINRIRGNSPEAKLILDRPDVVEMDARAKLEDSIVMASFETPTQMGFLTTILTAPTSEKLLAGMNFLQERTFWNRLLGDLAAWQTKNDSLMVSKVAPEFTYGASSLAGRARESMRREPIVFAIVTILVLALAGLLTRYVLASRKREMEASERKDKNDPL